ncbi:MAG: isoprenyl transferase [Lentisphaerae bacterium]|nr:isoprenyl transferase [Lentisphaerota bacterium]
MNDKAPGTPRHVAIIMDGNGRWARERGLPRIKGHEEGANSVRAVVRASKELGISYLTLYAFSVENWVRPKAEIEGLMDLLVRYLRGNEKELHEQKIRLRAMGRLEDLREDVRNELARVSDATAAYESGTLVFALSYGGRTEIANAAKRIARQAAAGTLDPESVDEKTVAANLYLPDVPDPDLLIRTSGEMRVSNFMLWQISYAELYVSPVMWPDFREENLKQAVAEYKRRRRRFGDIA